jgi:HD superfamily phosphohydrolase
MPSAQRDESAPTTVMLALRDPIHVYVRADDLEAAVLATRPLQRLRWVRQLGLAHLVFPGAEHSRFSHALGAMELAGRVYDALAEKAPDLLDTDPRNPERRRVRLAALLHDIGHAPFSHSAEELFEDGLSHEDMTARLLHMPEIESAVDRAGHGVDADSVERILTGRGAEVERLLAQIVSGELDVDKMDYLLRDSLYCGVRYGNYDLGRLLETITPLRDPATLEWGIGIDEGGVHALEALVLARYYMFTQVYFNVTGKVLELHLNEWLASEGIRWPATPERFLQHDDLAVWSAMRGSASHHARAIVERDHYALAFETREHTTAAERESFLALVEEARARFDSGDLLVSNSAKDPHRLGETTVLVRDRDGALGKMQDVSHFIRHLTRIERFRVYARPQRADAVRAFLRARWTPAAD